MSVLSIRAVIQFFMRSREPRGLEIVDRFANSFVKTDLRLPTEQRACASDIWPTHLWIVDRQIFVNNPTCRTGDFENLLGKLIDRHFHRVPYINRAVVFAHRKAEDPLDEVRNITETPGLTPVTEDRERFIVQCLADQRGYNTTIAQPHPWAIRIEDTDDLGVHAMKTMVRHRHCLGKSLSLIINASRANWVYIPPVIFVLRMHQWISVTLRSRSEKNFAPLSFAKPSELWVPNAPTFKVGMGCSK